MWTEQKVLSPLHQSYTGFRPYGLGRRVRVGVFLERYLQKSPLLNCRSYLGQHPNNIFECKYTVQVQVTLEISTLQSMMGADPC